MRSSLYRAAIVLVRLLSGLVKSLYALVGIVFVLVPVMYIANCSLDGEIRAIVDQRPPYSGFTTSSGIAAVGFVAEDIDQVLEIFEDQPEAVEACSDYDLLEMSPPRLDWSRSVWKDKCFVIKKSFSIEREGKTGTMFPWLMSEIFDREVVDRYVWRSSPSAPENRSVELVLFESRGKTDLSYSDPIPEFPGKGRYNGTMECSMVAWFVSFWIWILLNPLIESRFFESILEEAQKGKTGID